MNHTNANKLKKSENTVIRKTVISFVVIIALLMVSVSALIIVAHKGFVSTAETNEALKLVGPVQILNSSIKELISNYKLIGLSTPEESMSLLEQLEKIKDSYDTNIVFLEALTTKGNLNLDALNANLKSVEKLGSEMALAFIDGNKVKGKTLEAELDKEAATLEKHLELITTNTLARILESGEKLFGLFKLTRIAALIVASASLLLALIIVVINVRSVREAIANEQRVLKEKIYNVLENLSTNASTLFSSSKSLAESNTELLSSAEQQSQAAARVVSAIDEMTAIVDETAKHTDLSALISEKSKSMAKVGRSVLTKMSESVVEIQAANAKLVDIIGLMTEITNKTKAINDIVFQCRLLSFNASVEAARAGENGKGFSVVATEIANLAAESGKSAEAINQLLVDGNTKVKEVVSAIQEKTKTVEQVSKEYSDIFSNMENLNQDLNASISQINSATTELKIGISHSAHSINEIDKAIRFNNQTTINVKNQSNDIKTESDQLNSTMLVLKNIIED